MSCALLLSGCVKLHPMAHTLFPPKSTNNQTIRFHDVARAAGIDFKLGNANPDHVTALDAIGHGCAFLDFDGDGNLDVLLVGNAGARLYRNLGNGSFRDVTSEALPPSNGSHFLGCAVADYDGDGRPDIFLTGYGCTALYHNEGSGRFRDVTKGSGLEARGPSDWTTSAAWADIDGDGKLDLYVCRYVKFTPQSKQLCSYKTLDGAPIMMACGPTQYSVEKGSLYRNEGNGRFRDITAQAGLGDEHGSGLGCQFCDFNDSGRPSLYIANDQQYSDLYLNLGGGKFKNIGVISGTALGADGAVMSGMGVDWGDYDNNGRFDLLAANYAAQPKGLYHNEGNNTFVNDSYVSGIGAPTLLPLAFGAVFADLDNDGLLDIVFTNGHVQSHIEKVESGSTYLQSSQLLRNLGGGRFTDVTTETGPDFQRMILGRGIAVGDYDGDGRLDLLIVDDEGYPMLLHNDWSSTNHWIELRCVWKTPKTDAVGSKVTLTAGGVTQFREDRACGSYLSANQQIVHIGMGGTKVADKLDIRWPDGKRSTYASVAADHYYEATADTTRLRIIH